jgi:hypothetical protein
MDKNAVAMLGVAGASMLVAALCVIFVRDASKSD